MLHLEIISLTQNPIYTLKVLLKKEVITVYFIHNYEIISLLIESICLFDKHAHFTMEKRAKKKQTKKEYWIFFKQNWLFKTKYHIVGTKYRSCVGGVRKTAVMHAVCLMMVAVPQTSTKTWSMQLLKQSTHKRVCFSCADERVKVWSAD